MLIINIIKTIIYGIIEGITEWLPISSTGHLILFEELFWKNANESFFEMFRVVIQLGAILAVIVCFFNKLNPFSPSKDKLAKKETWEMWLKVIIACLPAAVIGLPFDDKLDAIFYNFITVAITLIVYGIAFIALESAKRPEPKITDISTLSYKTALLIGAFQLLALIPGTSRSGVTILSAMLLGCSRTVAAEFSFFLAIPVMFGASLLKCAKYAKDIIDGEIVMITLNEGIILLVGLVVAFLVSLFAIKFLMGYVKKRDFKPFGYYRIVLGIILLVYFFIERM
ncbi:MAG: undecaprenyl-diphosphate phosphatase [Ruminococcaceae bacterium]|nr:undecaprenyl-diphosphate phosphatase [Oscillospiraceae bacterium]